jgi:hypothetical protein
MDKFVEKVIESLKEDGIEYLDEKGEINPTPIAPRLVVMLAYFTGSAEEKAVLANDAVDYASRSFAKISLLTAPTTYAECADFNQYWRIHKVNCQVNRGIVRPVFMTLRDALKKAGR